MNALPILMHARSISGLLPTPPRKTQTRRIVKLPPAPMALGQWEATTIGGAGCRTAKGEPFHEQAAIWHTRTGVTIGCPYGAPGDLLWVREAWRTGKAWDGDKPRDIPAGSSVSYEADGEGQRMSGRYRHARFMPRWASRLALRLTDVRVERIKKISDADALAEGIVDSRTEEQKRRIYADQPLSEQLPHLAFAALWDDTNGVGAWSRNDYVWALTFNVLRENVDAVLHRLKEAA